MMDTVAMLKKVDLFAGLSSTQLDALGKMIVPKSMASGDVLFLQDDQADGFYVLASGGLQVYRTGMDGRRQILHVFEKPGDVCGEVAVFEGGTYPAAAEAVGDSAVLYLPRDPFLRLTRAQPDILLAMLAVLSRRLRRFVGLIDDLSLKDVGTRLAQYLISRADEAGRDRFTLSISKGMLASHLGTIAETVSRTLRKMQEQGLIKVDGRQIVIRDRAGLEEIAAGLRGL
jgi:CRP/FNR family transcriptional regulator, dissimilatory nitrate respiration regulator